MRAHRRFQKLPCGAENCLGRLALLLWRAPLAQPDHNIDKAMGRVAIGNRIMIDPNGAHANPGKRKDIHLRRPRPQRLTQRRHIDTALKIARILEHQMRQGHPPVNSCDVKF